LPPEIKAIIDAKVKRNRINYYFLVHYLYSLSIRCKNKNNGFININSNFFKSVTGYDPLDYKVFLQNGEFIISDNNYQVGKKSKHYKINPAFKTTPGFYEIPKDNKLYKSLKKNIANERSHVCRLPEYQQAMYKLFMSSDLDYNAALDWIANNTSLSTKQVLHYTFALENFRNKDFRYFKRNKTNNRLDSNLSNLPKDLRQFFVFPSLISIDLKNSQPFILFLFLTFLSQTPPNNRKPLCYGINFSKIKQSFGAWAIKDILKTRQNNEKLLNNEISRLNEWTTSGRFYESFLNHYKSDISRTKIKNIMIQVLFSRNFDYKNNRTYVPYEKDKKIFAEIFPLIYEIIIKLKEKNHANLPNALTKIESYIFIDNICPKLYDAGITPLTIHDSVIIPEKDAAKTLNIMQSTFYELTGYVPSFSMELVN
jgi:hypothetical protein